ncbi:hypothetical protein MK338_10180, partial [Streptococcus vestibularis]
YTLV